MIPTTAGLMKNAGARGIPWLISHSTKKMLEKHSMTRMNPRTWGRDSKHVLEWSEMAMGQSTEPNAPSRLGGETGEVGKQVWDGERYGKQQGTKWKYRREGLTTVLPKALLGLY